MVNRSCRLDCKELIPHGTHGRKGLHAGTAEHLGTGTGGRADKLQIIFTARKPGKGFLLFCIQSEANNDKSKSFYVYH